MVEGAAATRATWPEVGVEVLGIGKVEVQRSLEAVSASTVLLQYVGYGYSSSGCPEWLADGLRAWRSASARNRLFVMFHELWAHGPAWRRAFWSHARQKRIAVNLARTADAVVATTPTAQALLRSQAGIEAGWAPVPSNIPVRHRCWEVASAPEAWRVFVFGLDSVRRRAIHVHRHLYQELERRGRLEALVVVGAGLIKGDSDCPEAKLLAAWVPPTRVKVLGELREAEVSEALARCHLSVSATPPHLLGKSGTTMAAMAHGCPVVACGRDDPTPLVVNEHLLVHDGSSRGAQALVDRLDTHELKRIGLLGRAWYTQYADWRVHTALWRELLEG